MVKAAKKGPWPRRGARWTVAELKRVGKTPDSVLARRRGRTIKEVVAKRESRGIGRLTGRCPWTAREILLLGKMNDHELGRRLRRRVWTVSYRRDALDIPPFIPRSEFHSWTGQEIRLLGRAVDR